MAYQWYINNEGSNSGLNPQESSFNGSQQPQVHQYQDSSLPTGSSAFSEGFQEGLQEGMGFSAGFKEGITEGLQMPQGNTSMNQTSSSNPPISQQSTSQGLSQPQSVQHMEHTETSTPHADGSQSKSTVDHTTTATTSDSNPLGIPTTKTHAAQAPTDDKDSKSTHPPSNIENSTSTTSKPADATNPSNPLGIPTTNTHAAQAPTDDKGKPATASKDLPDRSLAPGSGAENAHSTPSTSATLPANPPANNTKTHKGLKTKFREWREKKKSGSKGGEVASSVHPVDTRTGKQLPSQDELAEIMNPDKSGAQNVLVKDPNDATGKSITGSDANPSKASNPFKAPTPAMKQAPIEAKAQ